jgi:nucleotide-binding universal stress UspA family protein
MTDESDVIELEVAEQPRAGRRGDGGIYLVVADESEEFPVALRYASRLAQNHRGRVAILYVTDIEEFQHWSGVETKMRKELREQSEMYIWNVAKKVNDLNGLVPVLYLREGDRKDALVDVINEDTDIKMLVLAAGTSPSGPGPLVSYFAGKGLSRLRVPVVIVPGHIELKKIDAIA